MAGSESQQTAPSVTNDAAPKKPRVIPSNQVVILRERELDCDLATAIQRVRDDEATRASRILIVGAAETQPSPASGATEPGAVDLPIPRLPMSIGQVARSAGQAALEACGARLMPKLQSLEQLLAEIRNTVAEADEAIVDGSRPLLKRQARVLGEIVAWMAVTIEDLDREVAGLSDGFQMVDIEELFRDLPGQIEGFFPGLRVNVEPAGEPLECWARAADLAEALFLAVVITAHRINAQGSVNVQFSAEGGRVLARLFGLGEPVGVELACETRRLRRIVVEQHRGHIVPDTMGPLGAGMVLDLPAAP